MCNTEGKCPAVEAKAVAISAESFSIPQTAQKKGGDMVGTVLAALGVAAALDLGVAEAPPLDQVGKLADAIALSRSCPLMTVDKQTVAATLARAGISIAPLVGEISRRSEAMEIRYMLLDRKSACAMARDRYGKAGTSAAGFLAER